MLLSLLLEYVKRSRAKFGPVSVLIILVKTNFSYFGCFVIVVVFYFLCMGEWSLRGSMYAPIDALTQKGKENIKEMHCSLYRNLAKYHF